MKRYYNKTTGEWYNEGRTMTHSTEDSLFSGVPTEEQLTEWGFEEWIEPAPPEPTPAELLERAKAEKTSELEIYDNSLEINGFDIILDGLTVTAWLTPEKRADYKNSLDSAELLGMEEVHPVFNGIPITLDIQTAKRALAEILIYANLCYGVTEQHKAAINALTTINEVEEYSYETGYPERLIFEIGNQ